MKYIILFYFLLFSGLSLKSQTLSVDFKSIDTSGRPSSRADKEDTIEFCAPHLYHFKPITSILDNTGKPVTSDSVIQWTWNWGEYGSKKDTLSKMDSFKEHIYSYNSDFTVSLTCITAKGLSKTVTKKDYIHQPGPGKFSFSFISDTSGPAPLHTKIKIHQDYDTLLLKNYITRLFPGNDSSIGFYNLKDTTITVTYNVAGTYYVSCEEVGDVYNFTTATTIKCSASWPDTSIHRPMKVVVTTTAGIENTPNEKENLSLYYLGNNLNVQWDSKNETYSLNLFDITGKHLLEKKITSSQKELINVSQLSKGIYIVHLNDGRYSIARKIAVW